MPRGKIALIAVVLYSIAAPSAHAHQSFEATPFFGSRFGGLIDETTAISPTVSYDHILIKSSFDYGGLFDYAFLPNLNAEFMFNRQPTVFTGHDIADNFRVKLADGTLDEYEWGILWSFRSSKAKVKPYIVAGFGFTQFSPSSLIGFRNRFSDSFGGGLKYFFADHYGIRFEARWSPAQTTTATGLVCGVHQTFPCYQATGAGTAQQGQANVGFIFRFK